MCFIHAFNPARGSPERWGRRGPADWAALGLLALCGLSCPTTAIAQLPDLLDVSVQYMPDVPLREPKPTTTQLSTYDGTLNVPWLLSDHTILIPGATYHVEAISFPVQAPSFIEPPRALHSLELPLLWVQLLPDGWSLAIRVAPGLSADRLALNRRQLRISGMTTVTRVWSSRLITGAGAVLSYSFGGLLPLPALYLDYQASAQLRLEAFFPAFLRLVYRLGDRLELGIKSDVQGNSYAILSPRYHNALACADEAAPSAPTCVDHVAYALVSAGLTVATRLFADVWLQAFVGHTLYRRFDVLDRRNHLLPGHAAGEQLPNAILFRLGATWRLPSDEDR